MDARLNLPVLLDNSAWARLGNAALPVARRDEVADAIEAGQVFVCLPFLLEAGYSARGGEDHGELFTDLLALPWSGIDYGVEQRAVTAQRELARAGHHRLPPVDLLIAALADRHGIGVLHYDRDYDVISSMTSLNFPSEWLAEAGVI